MKQGKTMRTQISFVSVKMNNLSYKHDKTAHRIKKSCNLKNALKK